MQVNFFSLVLLTVSVLLSSQVSGKEDLFQLGDHQFKHRLRDRDASPKDGKWVRIYEDALHRRHTREERKMGRPDSIKMNRSINVGSQSNDQTMLPSVRFVNQMIQPRLKLSPKERAERESGDTRRGLSTEGGPFYDDTCPIIKSRYHCWPRELPDGSKRLADWTLSLMSEQWAGLPPKPYPLLSDEQPKDLRDDHPFPGLFDSNLHQKYFGEHSGWIHTRRTLFVKPDTHVFVATNSHGRQPLETLLCMLYAAEQTPWKHPSHQKPNVEIFGKVSNKKFPNLDGAMTAISSFRVAPHLHVPCVDYDWPGFEDYMLRASKWTESSLDWFLRNREYGKDPAIIAELGKSFPELISQRFGNYHIINKTDNSTLLTLSEYRSRKVNNSVIEDLLIHQCGTDRMRVKFAGDPVRSSSKNRSNDDKRSQKSGAMIDFYFIHGEKDKSIGNSVEWFGRYGLGLKEESQIFKEWFCNVDVFVFNKGNRPYMKFTQQQFVKEMETLEEKRQRYCVNNNPPSLKIVYFDLYWFYSMNDWGTGPETPTDGDNFNLARFATFDWSKRDDFIYIDNRAILASGVGYDQPRLYSVLDQKYHALWSGHFCMPGGADHLALNLLESINAFFS